MCFFSSVQFLGKTVVPKKQYSPTNAPKNSIFAKKQKPLNQERPPTSDPHDSFTQPMDPKKGLMILFEATGQLVDAFPQMLPRHF